MKKIILIDDRGLIFDSIVKSKKICVDTVVLASRSQLENSHELAEAEILFMRESIDGFYINNYLDFDYEILLKFKHTELKVFSYFSRFTSDITCVRYIYAAALFYWLEKLKDPNILGVFCNEAEHGGIHDSVIIDVAKYYNKRVFIKSTRYGNYKGDRLDSVLDYTNNAFVNLKSLLPSKSDFSIDDFIFNSNISDEVEYSERLRKNNLSSFKLKRLIISNIEKIGGNVALLVLAKIFGKYKKNEFGFDIPLSRYLIGLCVCRRLSKYYQSVSVPGTFNANYIFFALHMEPEASIQVNTKFSDQLTIVKQISNALPEGWFLYVKEHPHQFMMNTPERSFYLPSAYKFKSKRYYDEIISLPNVKLVSVDVPSRQLIKNSRAVATINGTVATEAAINKKPVLIFSQGTTTLSLVERVHDISNTQQLRSALENIKSTRNIEYGDLNNIISDYHVLATGEASGNSLELVEALFDV